ncbi:hypothetical protein DMN91_002801 [Ooceraea biroi]|uniref:Uncharacterized protein n=1 Tax=Ooceraea biroi TaxID=2015173 RepID=A0A3L8DWP0_OOCBI|nr:hypothetical protein DMN91_002801 [Ooceraea biroi]
MPEGSSTSIPVVEEHPEEIRGSGERASERAPEEEEEYTERRRGTEKRRRRDLSFAATVQQPFVADRANTTNMSNKILEHNRGGRSQVVGTRSHLWMIRIRGTTSPALRTKYPRHPRARADSFVVAMPQPA